MGHRSEVNDASPLIQSMATKRRGAAGVIGPMRRRMGLAAVAGFAVAAAVASPAKATLPVENVVCGEVITHSLIVGNDLNCGSIGLVIGADHVRLDLGGHWLGVVYGAVVASTGHSDVTIANGRVDTQKTPIVLISDRNDTVRDVSATGALGPTILLRNVERSTVTGNVLVGELAVEGNWNSLTSNRESGYAYGAGIDVTGTGNVLVANVADNNYGGDGINIHSPQNVLVGNVADTNIGHGIAAVSGVISGLNWASGNLEDPQCVNVRCSSR